MDFTSVLDAFVVFLPLLGAMVAGFGGHKLGDKGAQFVTTGAIAASALLSFYTFYEVGFGSGARSVYLFPWIEAGGLSVHWTITVDTLAAVMMMVVTSISAMVHVYSIGYMHDDKGIPRFMSYLSLFTFFMLMLVTSGNLLQMFFGWEGVGLASYLLIGFWYEKESASKAAMKAFWVNRVGDFGFLLGIFACYQLFGSLNFDVIFKNISQYASDVYAVSGFSFHAITVIAMLLFMGAMGKSAQLGLHTWLPDAMEGPTPVSALIHAATMVTAGVFMIARMSPLFEYAPVALACVAVVGALTAIVAASIGLTQFDIKRVIAYSTMSQLGYMFFAAGVSAYNASIFHLMTHAFFKALLFLAAGSVIHAMSGEQDMRKMGGLWRKIPLTYGLMWIGSLSLAGIGIEGIFGFSGAYSKDMILVSAYAHGTWFGTLAYALGLMAAFMTAFYSWRLIVLTFHGKPRGDENVHKKVHESSSLMLVPLLPLALGALFAGALAHGWFASAYDGDFWKGSLFALKSGAEVHVPALAHYAPLLFALLGMAFASGIYTKLPQLPALIVRKLGGLYRFVLGKYYFDELYDVLFVRPLPRWGAFLWHKGDDGTIDRFGPDGAAVLAQKISVKMRTFQTGSLYNYAFVMVLALVVLLTWAIGGGI